MWKQDMASTNAEPADAAQENRVPLGASHPSWLRARWFMWLVVSVAFTAVLIQYTARRGRLQIWPTYDDVAHLVDGQVRLAALDQAGVPGLIKSLVQNPPNSPVFSLLATLSFLLMGNEPVVAYTSNVIFVFGLLMLVDRLTTGARWWERLGIAAFVLSVPASGMCVIEFRPDASVGLVTAAALLAMISAPLPGEAAPAARSSQWRWFGVGLLWALGLLIKPHLSPQTLLFAGAGFMAYAGVVWQAEKRFPRSVLSRRVLGPLILPTIVLAGPYYCVAFHGLWDYLYTNTLGAHGAVWREPGSWTHQAAYYLVARGGDLMFGADHSSLWFLLCLLVAGTVWKLVRVDQPDRARWFALVAVLVVTYLFPVLNPTKYSSYCASFAFLLMLLGVVVLNELMVRARGRLWVRGVAWMIIVATICLARAPVGNMVIGSPSGEMVTAIRRVEEGVAACIRRHPLRLGGKVYYTLTSYVDWWGLSYWELAAGNDLKVDIQAFTTDLEACRTGMNAADFVVAAEPGNGITAAFLPAGRLEDAQLKLVRSLPNFELLAVIPALHDKNFFVFGRVSPFRGFERAQGLGEMEGPYPQWNLPRVRWGLFPNTRIEVNSPADEAQTLSFRARSSMTGQVVTVVLNGQPLASVSLPDPDGGFEEKTLQLPMRAGRNSVELQYNKADPGQSGRAVLFTGLSLSEPATARSPQPTAP
jgi:hypothetical protein